MDLTAPFDRRGQPVPRSTDDLLRANVLDAELMALVGLLVEARVPLVVAGTGDAAIREALLAALLDQLPDDTRTVPLAGPTEDFAWLPEAAALGWRSDGPTPGRTTVAPVEPASTVLLAGELAPADGTATWAGVVRIAVRAVSVGYGLAGTVEAGSLEEVLGRLRAAPYRLTEDELSRLGLVVITATGVGGETVVEAAHYVRPVARDGHGHVQRLGPAVLASRDGATGRLEHFAWGVTPELALRTGRRAGDFEIEHARRRDALVAATAAPAAPVNPEDPDAR